VIRCQGSAEDDALHEAQQAFAAASGWSLDIQMR
jgi:hypothetical protein